MSTWRVHFQYFLLNAIKTEFDHSNESSRWLRCKWQGGSVRSKGQSVSTFQRYSVCVRTEESSFSCNYRETAVNGLINCCLVGGSLLWGTTRPVLYCGTEQASRTVEDHVPTTAYRRRGPLFTAKEEQYTQTWRMLDVWSLFLSEKEEIHSWPARAKEKLSAAGKIHGWRCEEAKTARTRSACTVEMSPTLCLSPLTSLPSV